MKRELLRIATQARNICQEYAFSYFAQDSDFYRRKDLKCMCAVASVYLAKVFRQHGLKPKVHYGTFTDHFNSSNHCWVTVCGFIVDITSSQFGFSNCLITPENDLRFCSSKVINCSSLRKSFSDWKSSQHPGEHNISKWLKLN